jgi:hypothetical protein
LTTVREAAFELFREHGMATIFGNPGSTELLSPLYNHRDDSWGGDPERRLRFPFECMRGIRRFLEAGESGQAAVLELAELLRHENLGAVDASPRLPFLPRSYRDPACSRRLSFRMIMGNRAR